MDENLFDAIARALTTSGSRRTTLRALLGTLAGGALLGPSLDALAAAGKRNGKGGGGGDTEHDRHADLDGTSTGRHKHLGKDHRRAHSQDRTDDQVPDSADELTPDPA